MSMRGFRKTNDSRFQALGKSFQHIGSQSPFKDQSHLEDWQIRIAINFSKTDFDIYNKIII